MPKISIGMPVYNGERFIRDALDSLVAQNFVDWELLIADNASTDATAKICNEFAKKDKRITYVRHDSNKGGLFNFQYVLNNATAEFFMWAAYDDIWENEFLNECSRLLNESPEKSVAFCEMLNVDTYNRPYREEKGFKSLSMASSCKLIYRYIMEHEFFGKANIFYGLYRTDIIKTVMNLPLDFNQSCDCTISLAVLARGGLTLSDKVLFRKRNARSTDTKDKLDFLVIDFKRPYKYENMDIVGYYLPNAFVALRNTRYLKCLYLVLPLRFIKIYCAVLFNYVRRVIVSKLRFLYKSISAR